MRPLDVERSVYIVRRSKIHAFRNCTKWGIEFTSMAAQPIQPMLTKSLRCLGGELYMSLLGFPTTVILDLLAILFHLTKVSYIRFDQDVVVF